MRRIGKLGSMVVVMCGMLVSGMVVAEELRVTFTNVKPDKGFLMVTLVEGNKSWKKAIDGSTGGGKGIKVKVGGERTQEVVFGGVEGAGLREGRYGILAYQDLDGDEKLKKGLFGIPQEPVGVSNNTPLLGPPKFKDAKIRLQEGESGIEIILR